MMAYDDPESVVDNYADNVLSGEAAVVSLLSIIAMELERIADRLSDISNHAEEGTLNVTVHGEVSTYSVG